MSDLTIAGIIFGLILASAGLGQYLQGVLPDHHLSEDSVSTVRLATGLIATMAALVLGLLISSAKGTFDSVRAGVSQNAARVERLDRTLAEYGHDTDGLRVLLKANYTAYVDLLTSGDPQKVARLADRPAIRRMDDFILALSALKPKNEIQVQLKEEAMDIADDVVASYWLTLLQRDGSVAQPLVVILVGWLTIIFCSFGLFAPRNATVAAALFLCALSAAAAVFLIREMDRPLDGMVRINAAPLHTVTADLGQ